MAKSRGSLLPSSLCVQGQGKEGGVRGGGKGGEKIRGYLTTSTATFLQLNFVVKVATAFARTDTR